MYKVYIINSKIYDWNDSFSNETWKIRLFIIRINIEKKVWEKMQSLVTTKNYYFIGTVAILFILVYKISDDMGELKNMNRSISLLNRNPFSFNVIFDSRWNFC